MVENSSLETGNHHINGFTHSRCSAKVRAENRCRVTFNSKFIPADVCFIYYEPKQWIWIFADTVCGHIISKFTDFYTTLAVLVIILILDCTTLFKLRMNNKVDYTEL